MHTNTPFVSYEAALAECGKGYDDYELARVRAYKTKHYVPQLDSILWPEQIANTALAVGLAAAHVAAQPLRVLDFGGGAGIHLYAARRVMAMPPRWAIVETRAMAEVAAATGLDAFDSIEQAVGHLGEVDLVHTSGTLQCTPDPMRALDSLIALEAPLFFVARMPVWRGAPLVTVLESRLSMNGLGPLPPGTVDTAVRYPITFVDFDEVTRRIIPRYRPLIALDASSAATVVNGLRVPAMTLLFARRS